MKNGIRQIVGKTITGVVVAANTRSPKQQLFLMFSDGTSLEFYGEPFTCGSGLDQADTAGAIRYAQKLGSKITATYPDAAHGASSTEPCD